MKTFFKSILAVAVCASLFAACSKDDTVSDPSNGRKVTMTVTASSELESASGSRTTYDPLTGKVSWNAIDEFLQVLETAASTTVFATSQEGVISGDIAKFAVTFPANENTPLVYNAVYPASAWVTSSNTDITNMKVITPTVQQPTATSFDSNADLLIAKSISLESQPTKLQMSFGRAVAIGKMTVKNLASAESVLGVKFTAPDKKVTGRSYVDMTAGTIKEYGYINNFADNVTLNYSSEMNITANSEAGMTAYFTCFPFEVAAGETFTVTVTTASKIFTKTVTVQEGRGRALAFAAGDSSTFAVDMTGATEEENETLSGDYVITVSQSNVNYAMSSAAEGNRLAPIVITPENPFKTDDETLVWTINKSGDNYTISQGENYLSWQGGSTNGATTSTSPYELVITKNKTGNTYQIASAAEPSRILAKNTTAANGFGFYAATQTKDLTLIPAVVDKSPKINITSGTTVNVPSKGDIVTVTYTIKNPNGSQISAKAEESATWINTFETSNEGEVSFTVDANIGSEREATITLTYSTATADITIKQAAQGQSLITYEEVTTLEAGEYIFVGNMSDTDYYLPNTATGTTKAPAIAALPSGTLSGSTITNPTADMTWTVTESGSGFTITSTADSSQALGTIADNNGLRIDPSYATNIWTFTYKASAKYHWAIENTTTSRFLAIYSTSSWRTYKSETTNQNGVFRLFKKQ
jgi:hypothetical protein